VPAALPLLSDAKAYLRATDSGAEDALILQLLDRATGAAQAYLARPILARTDTLVVELGPQGRPVLPVGASPIDTTQPITVVDGNGVTIDASSFRVNASLGLLMRLNGLCWDTYPYTVTLTWGLSARADFDTIVGPTVGAAILDAVADWFQRRNPAATSESAGGFVGTEYAKQPGLPPRVKEALDPYRLVTV
jgi:hypothetical protein